MDTVEDLTLNTEVEVLLHPELLQKFDINGPRYTSYPRDAEPIPKCYKKIK